MSIQFRSLAFVSFSLLALGCGDEDSNAQDKCETLVTNYCERAVSCAESAGLLDSSYSAADLREDCELSWEADVSCQDADKVSSSYGQCIRDVKALSCDDLNDVLTSSSDAPLPSSCNMVILRYPD
jgi:hypothetical protein